MTGYFLFVGGVVSKIPLSCGCFYVGHCVDDRKREHANSLRGTPSAHLAMNLFGITWPLIGGYKDRIEREILEVFLIRGLGDLCVSTSSLGLIDD